MSTEKPLSCSCKASTILDVTTTCDHFSGSSLATTYTGEFSKHYLFYGSLVSVEHQSRYGRHSKDCRWLQPATADKGFQYQHQPKLIS